ncbi:permease prefix domain 1-containing protein [Deinococcus oregonensis]|uniref:Permease prefix domain 1-containing protein n=1 Tax=Deinococcus oregonensis TaxID=1805970 RepID=A0ABV6B5T5_9DEIO
MNRQEQFLRAATRGLPKQAKAAVQSELRSHLYERTHQLRLTGMNEADALIQAIQELGPAPTIARGLNHDHGFSLLKTLVVILLGVSTAWVTAYKNDTEVTSWVNQRLFPEPAWIDPCHAISPCRELHSEDPLIRELLWTEGLIHISELNQFLELSGLKVQGLFHKQLALSGFEPLPIQPVMTSVGRAGVKGRKSGFVDVPQLLLNVADHQWPLAISEQSEQLQLTIRGRVIGASDPTFATTVVSKYLQVLLERELEAPVEAAGRYSSDPTAMNSLSVQGWSWPRRLNVPYQLTIPAPRPDAFYALVTFDPAEEVGLTQRSAVLRAQHVLANATGQLIFPLLNQERKGQSYALVASPSRFLAQVGAGVNTAMLLEVPRHLKVSAGLQSAALSEQTLRSHKRADE